MANRSNAYGTIPPPPLSDFYRPRTGRIITPSENDKEMEASVHYDYRHETVRREPVTHEKWTATYEVPHSASAQSESEVPALAVYHICRICLRPRSARYHEEHPIPADGLPPPPGICRRCRVVPAEKTSKVGKSSKTLHVVEQHDSNDIRLGISAFVPEADCVSNGEMRQIQADYLLENADWQELEPPPDQPATKPANSYSSHYTHAAIPPPPPTELSQAEYKSKHSRGSTQPKTPLPEPEAYKHQHKHIRIPLPPPSALSSIPRLKVTRTSTAQDVIDAVSEKPKKSNKEAAKLATVSQRIPKASAPPTPSTMDIVEETRDLKAHGKKTATSTYATKAVKPTKNSSSHRSSSASKPHSELEIRRFARDEVVRYRQAECKLEAHLDPYAHGRLVPVERVPVERRIETVNDTAVDKPWLQKPKTTTTASDSMQYEHVQSAKHKAEKQEFAASVQSRHKPRTWQPQAKPPPPPSSNSSSSNDRLVAAMKVGKDDEDMKEINVAQVDRTGNRKGPRMEVRRVDLPGASHDVVEFAGEEPYQGEVRAYVPVSKDKPWIKEMQDDPEGFVLKGAVYAKGPGSALSTQLSTSDVAEIMSHREADSQFVRDVTKAEPEASAQASNHRATGDWRGLSKAEALRKDSARGPREADIDVDDKGAHWSTDNNKTSQQQDLPYPRDDGRPMAMPSPRSHMSRPNALPPQPRKQDDDEWVWEYRRRTIQPADEPWDDHAFDEDRDDAYYKVTHERFARHKSPSNRSKNTTPPTKRRGSNGSGRVHFSGKVNYSPTPPNSDTSSSDFRKKDQPGRELDFRVTKQHGNESHNDRGRPHGRPHCHDDHGYYYERGTARTTRREYSSLDGGRTPRPSSSVRRTSRGESETATGLSSIPSGVKAAAVGRSESPSEEVLLAAHRAGKGWSAKHQPRTTSRRRAASPRGDDLRGATRQWTRRPSRERLREAARAWERSPSRRRDKSEVAHAVDDELDLKDRKKQSRKAYDEEERQERFREAAHSESRHNIELDPVLPEDRRRKGDLLASADLHNAARDWTTSPSRRTESQLPGARDKSPGKRDDQLLGVTAGPEMEVNNNCEQGKLGRKSRRFHEGHRDTKAMRAGALLGAYDHSTRAKQAPDEPQRVPKRGPAASMIAHDPDELEERQERRRYLAEKNRKERQDDSGPPYAVDGTIEESLVGHDGSELSDSESSEEQYVRRTERRHHNRRPSRR